MKFYQLLRQRDDLVRQARLANAAVAYHRVVEFTQRIAGAPLRGLVRLTPGDPANEHPWPALTALEGSQAVIEEYFLDEEIVELVDIREFLSGPLPLEGVTLRWDELEASWLPILRAELSAAGIEVPRGPTSGPVEKSGPGRLDADAA